MGLINITTPHFGCMYSIQTKRFIRVILEMNCINTLPRTDFDLNNTWSVFLTMPLVPLFLIQYILDNNTMMDIFYIIKSKS